MECTDNTLIISNLLLILLFHTYLLSLNAEQKRNPFPSKYVLVTVPCPISPVVLLFAGRHGSSLAGGGVSVSSFGFAIGLCFCVCLFCLKNVWANEKCLFNEMEIPLCSRTRTLELSRVHCSYIYRASASSMLVRQGQASLQATMKMNLGPSSRKHANKFK